MSANVKYREKNRREEFETNPRVGHVSSLPSSFRRINLQVSWIHLLTSSSPHNSASEVTSYLAKQSVQQVSTGEDGVDDGTLELDTG
jgi:hypothetical protein